MIWKLIASNWRIIAAALLVLMLIITAKIARNNYDRAIAAEYELKLSSTTIKDMQARQHDVAALDAKYTKELADANAENAALQRKLDNGGRVHVKGHCPVPVATPSPGSMGNDASIELSSASGHNILDIRAGITNDQAKVKYLQDYIRQQCRGS